MMLRLSSVRLLMLALALVAAGPAQSAPAPLIVSISPERAAPEGGAHVTLVGDFFVSGLTVMLCGRVVPDATFVTRNQIDFTSPPRAIGRCDVTVTNPDGQRAVMPGGLAYSLETPSPAGVFMTQPQPAPAVLGAPLPPASNPLAAASPRPSAPPGPDRIAVKFLETLQAKQDLTPLSHPYLRLPVPAGVLFGWQFSDAYAGSVLSTPIVHFEGRVESVNASGQRAWLPFVMHVTQEAPSRVTAFVASPDPAASRETLFAAIENSAGATISMDWSRAIRPLPGP